MQTNTTMTSKEKQELKSYIESNIDDFDILYSAALTTIGNYRCLLQHADHSLYDRINELAHEWGDDAEIDEDQIDEYIEDEYFM